MLEFKIGDLVVLVSGSMRMAVESVEKEKILTVWCNEGVIGRDSFHPTLLKKWEFRDEDKTKSLKATNVRQIDKKVSRDSVKNDRSRGKIGWDGKAREKKFFRKE